MGITGPPRVAGPETAGRPLDLGPVPPYASGNRFPIERGADSMTMSYVIDMDGVVYHGSRLIPGALAFVVLSGVTTREMIDLYPYRPTLVFEDVGHIPIDQLG
jgi:hypothetical protein